MKLKFRGYDNPVVEGHTSPYQDGEFTVGGVYETREVDEHKLMGPYVADDHGRFPDAQLIDDIGQRMWEELMFFDIVED